MSDLCRYSVVGGGNITSGWIVANVCSCAIALGEEVALGGESPGGIVVVTGKATSCP